MALYRDTTLASTLPAMLHASANDDGGVRSRSGYPSSRRFSSLERGMTLREWMQQKRGFGETVTMVRLDCCGHSGASYAVQLH